MIGTIAIEGIEIFAYHGVYQREREKGTAFVVDVYLKTEIKEAAETDELESTVDYFSVYQKVLTCMESPVHLLETLTVRIGQGILSEFENVMEARVKVTKIRPYAMRQCEQTYVEMTFTS